MAYHLGMGICQRVITNIKRFRPYFLSGFYLLLCLVGNAQQTRPVRYDTIRVNARSYMAISDSIYYFAKDTVIILPDSIRYRRDRQADTREFYETLKTRMGRRKLTKALFNALISVPRDPFQVDSLLIGKSTDPYAPYEGKIVGEISLNKLTVFGPEVNDTTKQAKSGVQRVFNDLHWKTSGNVIRNNFLLKPGQVIRAAEMSDAERVLRELEFIRDARIEVRPRAGSDTVDLVIITQDVFPYTFEIEPRDFDAGVLDLGHRNLFGLGYELDYRVQISNNREQVFNWFSRFRIPNIRRTFTTGEITYGNTFRERGLRASINRDFISPEIMTGGGAEYARVESMYERFNRQDTLLEEFYARSIVRDAWLGRAFRLGLANPDADQRTRLVLAARYAKTHFLERPFGISENENQFFHSSERIYGSISLSQRRFFRDRLVYGYGRTEDIPVGYLFEFTKGYEWREFYNRDYWGARASVGKYIGNLGYFYALAGYETHLREDRSREQGWVKLETRYVSNLLQIREWRFRQFVTFRYDQGINRFEDEWVTVNNLEGIRGLNSLFFRDTHKLTLNLETVAFTPIDLIGFRVAIYGFTDIGYITDGSKNIWAGTALTGVGAGIRIRNDNLTFKAFEVRFAYFPNVPMGLKNNSTDFAGSPRVRFNDFNTTRPGPRPFR